MQSFRRLAEDLSPQHYDVCWRIPTSKDAFSGEVRLQAELKSPSNKLRLHAKQLKITKAAVMAADESYEIDSSTIQIEDHDVICLVAPSELPAGKMQLNLSFEGTITEQMHGIYPCNFMHGGQAKRLIGTQFESHHAREAFPCIDEPAAKATFGVTLVTPEGEEVVANTLPKSSETKDGERCTVFEETPIMSTYLLAFVVGEMKFLESKTASGTLVRTWATPDNVEHTKFALETAVRCLDYFNEYFDLPYPLAKCDLLALPDFSAGAMENWGCITFREAAMLYDPANTSLAEQQHVGLVVAHELAHQWFGNLVTMDWWTDLWLNEGFASWVEYLALDHLFPEWRMWEQFVTDDYLRGLSLDALEHTHAVEVPIDNPDDIRSIFDAISYSKGASVIRMLHEYLGPGAFREGLRYYLQQHAYGNAATKDLWAALEKTSGLPVRDFMSAWTSQAGFPLLRVESQGQSMHATQSRYMINPRARAKVSDASVWPVPISTDASGEQVTLTTPEGMLPIDGAKPKLNRGHTGFYLTAYEPDWLQELSQRVQQGQLEPIDRLGLLYETWQLAKAGLHSTEVALKLLESYEHERELTVWEVIVGQLTGVRQIMDDDQLRDGMKPFVARLVNDEFNRLGWEEQPEESHADRLMRPLILGQASFAEIPAVVKSALERWDAMQQPTDQPPDLRGVVYGTAVRERDEAATFDKLWGFYTTTDSAQEKTTLASALTGFKDPALIDRALAAITSDEVKLQEVPYWVAYSFGNRHGKTQAWQWLKANWDWLADKFGGDISTIAYFPRYAAQAFNSNESLAEFKAFFKDHTLPGMQRPVDQAIETIEWQADWRERDLQAIKSYFKAG